MSLFSLNSSQAAQKNTESIKNFYPNMYCFTANELTTLTKFRNSKFSGNKDKMYYLLYLLKSQVHFIMSY